MNSTSKVFLLAAAVALGGCSALESDKVDYRSTAKAPSLDIPPDLTQLSKDTRYTVIGGAVSASGYQANQAATNKAPIAALAVGDVRIERAGNQRWLVVNRPAEKLWEPVKDFWQENGFLLAMDQSNLGIMETDWAENRAKIPQDLIRATLGKLLDSLYSTGERDKFRTRIERDANGNSEIFISHRGMQEVYTNTGATATGDKQTMWQPRPADPELEAEFLRRLMVKLGMTPEQAKAQVAASTAKPTATVSTVNGQPAVLLEEGFDRAWRRVGLALDRTGFTVEDRDRKQGIYFVRYVAATSENSEPGFFSKLFSGSGKTAPPAKYQIAVRSQGESSTVNVLDAAGAPETSAVAQRIVKVIADDIK
ncbi:outer membrane protein assembly factor BamC [Rhodoferax saidenbachensis]|uniref:Outer membrane protein assembly factor BamC n=1 Tax=Rhodoferax saidenbachensis TaxID=1484693 RepID=A0ABU1ZQK0_9BURK|nr:outer membrane protein assembly factor BamC [Rhodoferax saidenbachensis]MDR7307828.1 outer membrane protein assembly factor BamC [Rhodoferax saidenbachensis]